MKIYRVILVSKKETLRQFSMSDLINSIKRKMFKYPIFIGTTKQWNDFIKEIEDGYTKEEEE